ncbi:MAG: hypothetical protein PSN35_02925, partial [Candidatus Thioglobus sp.]|uniref:hypothetical protein n=1 Tax=Candidatus Thioglobus sp. TaxID=2026721 RepID=UPI002602BC45
IMKRNNIITLGVLAMGATTSALAGTEMDALKDRITALETAASATVISGELSAEYTSSGKTAWGDAKLTMSHAVSDEFDGAVTIKKESSSSDTIIFDEAMINYNNENFTASIGRIGVPFGGFSTGMITDPLTKGVTGADIGGKDLIMLATDIGGIEVSAYSYKDTDNDSGVTIGYATDMFSVGYDHFNDGTSGVGKSKAIRVGFDAGNGMSIAYEKVTVGTTGVDLVGTHVEAAYAHTLAGMDATIVYATSDEDEGTNSDQSGVTYSVAPAEGITFALERNKVKGASAVNTAKITYEF